MLNLSDKELDRLAREAANEYDPGDLTNPGSWDRMHLRLDNEMGYPRMNFFRSIRRMSVYYAPAILLLAGVSYFLLRPSRSHSVTHPPGSPATAQAEPSGSPPVTEEVTATGPAQGIADRSIKNQNNTYRSNSTQASPLSAKKASVPFHAGQKPSLAAPAPVPIPPSGQLAKSASGQLAKSAPAAGSPSSPEMASAGQQTPADNGSGNPTRSRLGGRRHDTHPDADNHLDADNHPDASVDRDITSLPLPGATTASNGRDQASAGTTTAPASPSSSVVRGIRSTQPDIPAISDSALRKIAPGTIARAPKPINPGKKNSPSLHIDRPLQIGVSLAPDFTSVNSLAGDKPGSSIGITLSYQLFDKWHLQTGLLFSHKNYTAAQEDYHVPYDYYRMNNMHNVYFVKGTLNLFEIPLNLRYDFSMAGNTTFFISGGLSSYLLTHENCNYYFDLFGRTVYQEFKYDGHQNKFFGTVNLSMGVETGLSNSLSLLIAPYMKIPTAGLGFGRIEMNSVGVEFGLKYAPVLRRKRH